MNKHLDKLRNVAGGLAAAYLVYMYIAHGVPALFSSPGMTGLIQQAGLPFAEILIRIVGVLDIAAAAAIVVYRKWWVSLYTGIWPLVPMTITAVVTGQIDWTYLQFPLLAAIMYVCLDWKAPIKSSH